MNYGVFCWGEGGREWKFFGRFGWIDDREGNDNEDFDFCGMDGWFLLLFVRKIADKDEI